jgi:hypothetical protein
LKIIVVFAALNGLFALSVLGLAFSVMGRNSTLTLAPPVAGALWPSFMVVGLSLFGYLHAVHFSGEFALGLIGAGLVWTAYVGIRHRSNLAAMDWRTAVVIQSISLLSGLLVILPQVWHNDFGYSEFGNGEFLNYAQLASYSLGLQKSAEPVAWEQHHQLLRDAVDFINATVSLITGQEGLMSFNLPRLFYGLPILPRCSVSSASLSATVVIRLL